MKTFFSKFLLFFPLFAGLCFFASDCSAKEKKKKPEITTENNISVDIETHDFGTIKEDSGNVSAIFTLTNGSKSPILIQNVQASCGCTTPSKTEEPIEPGKTGEVKAVYNPKGRPGPFEKTITIVVKGGEKTETIRVKIKGTVEN
jgi:hypothetical protein